MEPTDLLALIAPLIPSTPVMIAMAVGFVIALIRRSRHPRASLLAMIGFGGHALSSVCGTMAYQVLLLSMSRAGEAANTIGATTAGFGIAMGLVDVIWWGCLIAAIFADRPNPNTSSSQ